MAQIPQYDGPDRQLLPNDKGTSAFEQAGRRTGPAYNEAATLTKQKGAAENEAIKMRRWAFDMLNLEKSIEAPTGIREMPSKNAGGLAFSVQGGVDNNGFKDKTKKDKDTTPTVQHDGGARGKVASGLSQIGAAMARGNQYRSQTIDTASGLDINDPKLKPKRYSKVLEGGSLVTYDRLTGQTSKAKPGPNAKAEQEAKDAGTYTQSEWADPDNKKLNDQFKRTYGYDPATGHMDNRSNADGKYTGKDIETGVQPGAEGNYNYRGTENPSGDYGGGRDEYGGGDPGGSTDYRAMQRSMAPGAAGEVANTVSDMQDSFGGGSDDGSGGSSGSDIDTGAGSGGGYSNSESGFGSGDFGGGGDEE